MTAMWLRPEQAEHRRTAGRRATKVVMVPSVSGGIGHISRTAALARALTTLDPSLQVEYLLDSDRLRPFNVDACRRMGFRPRFLPKLSRDSRDAIVRACLDDVDVIVEDCSRYLLPLRRAVPQAAWVSIPMHPVGDELFMDWPFMAQMDLIIWAYAPLVGLPSELEPVRDKVVQTGPFLETASVPDRAAARSRLGVSDQDELVVYAPRGFPFGRDFGHRVLSGVYAAVAELRGRAHPRLTLALLAVSDLAELRGVPGLADPLPKWVRVEGVLAPPEALLYTRAADVLIAEGTSSMHEGAALRTPLILVPGPIQEATLLAQGLADQGAAQAFKPQQTNGEAFARAFEVALSEPARRDSMLDRAFRLVTGGGGAAVAARRVLDLNLKGAVPCPSSLG